MQIVARINPAGVIALAQGLEDLCIAGLLTPPLLF
jgi:hypothetical protein